MKELKMLTKQQEADALETLNAFFDVVDAYFHKGVLFVVNSYDVPAVEDYLEVAPAVFKFRAINEDEYAT